MLFKKLLCGSARRSASHDVPRHDDRVFGFPGGLSSEFLDLEDALGLELEERLFGREANVEAAFWRGGAETSSLSTGHEDYRDLVRRDQRESEVVPFLEIGFRGVEDGGGGRVGEGLHDGGLGRRRGVERFVGEFL